MTSLSLDRVRVDAAETARVPTTPVDVGVVAVTSGSASLGELLRSLIEAEPDDRVRVTQVVLVDDRPRSAHDGARASHHDELASVGAAWLDDIVESVQVIRQPGCGTADALAVALPSLASSWVVVLDQSVVVTVDWWSALADDLCNSHERTGASIGTTTCDAAPDRADVPRRFGADRAIRVSAMRSPMDSPTSTGDSPTSTGDIAHVMRAGWTLSLGSRRTSWSNGETRFDAMKDVPTCDLTPPGLRMLVRRFVERRLR